MITNNPFSALSEIISPIAMQGFAIAMIGLVALGTLIDIIHKKNVKYFFDNAKKAKKSAKIKLSTATKPIIAIAKPCIAIGDIISAKAENGLLVIIYCSPLNLKGNLYIRSVHRSSLERIGSLRRIINNLRIILLLIE